MTEEKAGSPGGGLIGSLLHGLAVLDMFTRDRTVIGIGEMAQHLGVHRSTTSRLAATLSAAGYLEPVDGPGRYRLTSKLIALGDAVAAGGDVRRAALVPLRDLVAELGETGHLAVLEGDEAVTVELVDGWHTVRMHSWVGKRSPAHCSSMGKALLAGLPESRFEALYPGPVLASRTPNTITDREQLERELDRVREQGHAVDLEELEEGLCCVAAPVFDRSGAVAASISVSGPPSRISESTIPELAARVRSTARRISERLGAVGGSAGPNPARPPTVVA
jgi:DNA-binding IclR family transcriptional regulator